MIGLGPIFFFFLIIGLGWMMLLFNCARGGGRLDLFEFVDPNVFAMPLHSLAWSPHWPQALAKGYTRTGPYSCPPSPSPRRSRMARTLENPLIFSLSWNLLSLTLPLLTTHTWTPSQEFFLYPSYSGFARPIVDTLCPKIHLPCHWQGRGEVAIPWHHHQQYNSPCRRSKDGMGGGTKQGGIHFNKATWVLVELHKSILHVNIGAFLWVFF